jgi:hypothetical protein
VAQTANFRINSVLRLESDFIGDVMIEVFLLLPTRDCSDGVEIRLHKPLDEIELFVANVTCFQQIRRRYIGLQSEPTVYELSFNSGEHATCDKVDFVMRLYSLSAAEAQPPMMAQRIYANQPLLLADTLLDGEISQKQGFNGWYYMHSEDADNQATLFDTASWSKSIANQLENQHCWVLPCLTSPAMYVLNLCCVMCMCMLCVVCIH